MQFVRDVRFINNFLMQAATYHLPVDCWISQRIYYQRSSTVRIKIFKQRVLVYLPADGAWSKVAFAIALHHCRVNISFSRGAHFMRRFLIADSAENKSDIDWVTPSALHSLTTLSLSFFMFLIYCSWRSSHCRKGKGITLREVQICNALFSWVLLNSAPRKFLKSLLFHCSLIWHHYLTAPLHTQRFIVLFIILQLRSTFPAAARFFYSKKNPSSQTRSTALVLNFKTASTPISLSHTTHIRRDRV